MIINCGTICVYVLYLRPELFKGHRNYKICFIRKKEKRKKRRQRQLICKLFINIRINFTYLLCKFCCNQGLRVGTDNKGNFPGPRNVMIDIRPRSFMTC